MTYRLEYIFNAKCYKIEEEATSEPTEFQYEAIAEGLALTSAEKSQHEPYGKYTDMSLFVNGECVWTDDCRIITPNNTYTYKG